MQQTVDHKSMIPPIVYPLMSTVIKSIHKLNGNKCIEFMYRGIRFSQIYHKSQDNLDMYSINNLISIISK